MLWRRRALARNLLDQPVLWWVSRRRRPPSRSRREALLASVNTDAGQTQARAADERILAILKALTLLRTAGSEPTAIVVTPATYESTRSATATAYTGGPAITVDTAGEKWWAAQSS